MEKIINKCDTNEWVFIMVSLDTDIDKWKNKITELKQFKNHFIVKDGHKSQFNKDYKIGYAPRYIIIDKNGELINFNAYKPSDYRTRNIILK